MGGGRGVVLVCDPLCPVDEVRARVPAADACDGVPVPSTPKASTTPRPRDHARSARYPFGDLAAAAKQAEAVAEAVIPGGTYFSNARQLVRQALKADGIAAKVDELVKKLLDR